jgi:putative copper export protein
MLSLVILPYFNERANSDDRVQAAAVGRFSFIAGCAATAVCVTSLYNAWVYVGSLAALVSPGYGWTVMAKMVLLTLLLAVAGFHRFVVVPRLHELAEGLASPRRYVAAAIRAFAQTYDRTSLRKLFMLGVRIEVVLILCILLCAAALRQQIPARHVSHNLENGAGQHAH